MAPFVTLRAVFLTSSGSTSGTLVYSRSSAAGGAGALASWSGVGFTSRLVTEYCAPRVFWPRSPTRVRPVGSYRQRPLICTFVAGYGSGSQLCLYEPAAEMFVLISVAPTDGLSPSGRGSSSGTSLTLRSEDFQAVPSNWSSATIRRYRSWVFVALVRYRMTSRSSG